MAGCVHVMITLQSKLIIISGLFKSYKQVDTLGIGLGLRIMLLVASASVSTRPPVWITIMSPSLLLA